MKTAWPPWKRNNILPSQKQRPDPGFLKINRNRAQTGPGSYAWRVYNVQDEGNTIELKALQFDKGPRVALLMLPGCEIAETAMGEILADPVLAPIFRERGTVITNRVNAGTIALWKKYFNFPEVYLAYKASDFPGFNFGSSPNFYFLADGKIKYSFSGWSNPNIPGLGKNEMLKGLAAVSISTLTHTTQ